MSIEVKELCWSSDKNGVLAVEQAAFPYFMQSGEQDLRRQAEKGFGLIVIHDSQPCGYVLAVPLEETFYPGCLEDMARGIGNTFYIESLAVEAREHPIAVTLLAKNLKKALSEKGIKKVTMHVEVDSHLYKTILRQGAKDLRHFENWQDWGKTFAYLEMDL